MLLEKSAIVYQDLSTFSALTDLLSNGVDGIRPLVAEVEDGASFINYALQFEGYATKGVIAELNVIVNCWAKTYDESLAIADQVEEAFKASTHFYRYVSAKPMFNEQNEIYTQQIFNIKN